MSELIKEIINMWKFSIKLLIGIAVPVLVGILILVEITLWLIR